MRLARNALAVTVLVAAAAQLAGCMARWTYPPDPKGLFRATGAKSDLVIAVVPFREVRPEENSKGTFFLYLIPLMPFGWITYERPEMEEFFPTIGAWRFVVGEDLGSATAQSLEQSEMFKRVFLTRRRETQGADYVMQGTANHTLYEAKIYSYGLSAFGPLLWLFGAPAGSSQDTLDVTFSLTDRTNAPVWSYTFTGSQSVIQGIYYNFGTDVEYFPALMQAAMNAALKNLEPEIPRLEKLALEQELRPGGP